MRARTPSQMRDEDAENELDKLMEEGAVPRGGAPKQNAKNKSGSEYRITIFAERFLFCGTYCGRQNPRATSS